MIPNIFFNFQFFTSNFELLSLIYSIHFLKIFIYYFLSYLGEYILHLEFLDHKTCNYEDEIINFIKVK